MEAVEHKPGVITIEPFFIPAECQLFIDKSEELGFEEATVSTTHGAVMMKGLRNNDRLIFNSFEVANDLWPRLRPFIDRVGIPYGRPKSINERFRVYRYGSDQRFKRHLDGSVEVRGLKSFITFMVYLNDDFEGGATKFQEFRHQDGERIVDEISIQPKAGKTLLFQHDLWHEGEYVLSGQKYVLRSDIFFEDWE
ncbi:MAG: 2OG-Fe(II) oxygenase [Verrucomicrobiota bacterium]